MGVTSGVTSGRGSWVVGRGSWVVGRGSWVVSRESWVVGRGSWVVGIYYYELIINPCFRDAGRDYGLHYLGVQCVQGCKTWRRSTHAGITLNLRISVPFTSNKSPPNNGPSYRPKFKILVGHGYHL